MSFRAFEHCSLGWPSQPATFHLCHQFVKGLQPVSLSRFHMKSARLYEQHLTIQEAIVPPGGEWVNASPGWVFVHVSSGTGFWLGTRGYYELATGSSLIVAEQTQGYFRASQTSGGAIDFFRVQL